MKKINWRYAIGELIIITIGISIAFALNNWADRVREREVIAEYQASLRADLHSDIVLLDSNINEMERRSAYLQRLLANFRQATPGRDTLALKFFKSIDPVPFSPHEATWQSLQSSGDIKLIETLDLRNQLVAHYILYGNVEREYQRHYHFAKDFLAPFFMEVDFQQYFGPEGRIFEDNYFRNLSFSLYGIYQYELNVQRQARSSAEALLAQL